METTLSTREREFVGWHGHVSIALAFSFIVAVREGLSLFLSVSLSFDYLLVSFHVFCSFFFQTFVVYFSFFVFCQTFREQCVHVFSRELSP